MDPQRWHQLRELYEQAAGLEKTARENFLHGITEQPLRNELASLLAAQDAMGPFLETPSVPAATASDDPWLGRTIGVYQLLDRLGEGGMGIVFLAVRADGEYERRVALKLVRPSAGSAEIVRRFRTERQILAALDHPHIARLLDGGTTADGWPYLVMEHVEGRPIDRYCDESALGLRERLELFRKVCAAVQYAHQNLVVHRDLKPSNILVTADGIPKLLDFGIAKLLGPELGPTVAPTALGLRPMTPDYASPEQVRGEPVSTASDVFLLGVLLYLLLTGRHPHRGEHSTPIEVARSLCEQNPQRPSTAVLETGQGSGAERRRLRRQLAGDLDDIVLKALRKEPQRRYASAHELGEDIRRHLEGLPVAARGETFPYLLGKFVRRHRLAVAALVAAIAVGIGFLTTLVAQRAALERQRDRAERVTQLLLDLFEGADPESLESEPRSLRGVLDRCAARLAEGLEGAPDVRASLDRAVGTIFLRLAEYPSAKAHLEAALASERRLADGDTEAIVDLLGLLGALHLAQGDFEAAERQLDESLAIGRDLLGADHPRVLKTTNDRAGVYLARGELARAEELYREVLAQRREQAPSSLEIAESFNNLGTVLYYQGKNAEAESAYREALERSRRLGGERHLWVATALANLATMRLTAGELEKAETLYRESLAICRELLGARHPDVATVLNNLAATLKLEGRLEESVALFRESLAIRREVLGEDHPEMAESLGNLGATLRAAGETREAEELLLASLALARRVLGSQHSRVAGSLFHLAGLRLDQGRPREAEAMASEALEIFRATFAADHPRIAETEALIAKAQETQGHAEKKSSSSS